MRAGAWINPALELRIENAVFDDGGVYRSFVGKKVWTEAQWKKYLDENGIKEEYIIVFE